ncbi:MAG: hypothetical protein AAF527_06160, partial [Pseudomonadota bacterium]
MADDDRGGLRAFDQDRPPSGDDDGGGGWFSQLGLTLKLVALGFGGLVVVGVIGLVAAAIYV